jgi:hypothetical protein
MDGQTDVVNLYIRFSNTISLPYKAEPIKFHDLVNCQERTNHQKRGATPAQQGMTLQITSLQQNVKIFNF